MAAGKNQIRYCVLTAWLALLSFSTQSQSILQSRQFQFDPYLFNVAHTGEVGKTHALLYYRQQWLQIDDSPLNFGFSLQHPVNKKTALGLSFNSTSTVALHNDDIMGSFAYKISVNEKQSIRFGVSGGVSVYKLDLDGADFSNDPVVLNSAAGKSYLNGNFGILYNFGKLKVGAALPELFGKNHLTRSASNRQLLNQLYSASISYHIKSWPEDILFTNYFLYRLSYDFQNFWEGGVMLKWKDIIKVGINYRQYSGLGFLLGVQPVQSLRFSYSFEPGTATQNFIRTSSHELHLDLCFLEIIKKFKSEATK
jgi:type IX secretion system PorP/SprF family membrane protein